MPAEIAIAPMVAPLRYDILIRKSFFDYCWAERSLRNSAPKAFLSGALEHEYFQWFTNVLMVRYHPKDRDDLIRTKELYTDRVRQAIALHDSMERRGFDPHFPIIPVTGETIRPATSGRPVSGRFFMGDGCHRLAYLMSRGYESLPRKFVRIKCFRTLSPLDNSALLEGHVSFRWNNLRSKADKRIEHESEMSAF